MSSAQPAQQMSSAATVASAAAHFTPHPHHPHHPSAAQMLQASPFHPHAHAHTMMMETNPNLPPHHPQNQSKNNFMGYSYQTPFMMHAVSQPQSSAQYTRPSPQSVVAPPLMPGPSVAPSTSNNPRGSHHPASGTSMALNKDKTYHGQTSSGATANDSPRQKYGGDYRNTYRERDPPLDYRNVVHHVSASGTQQMGGGAASSSGDPGAATRYTGVDYHHPYMDGQSQPRVFLSTQRKLNFGQQPPPPQQSNAMQSIMHSHHPPRSAGGNPNGGAASNLHLSPKADGRHVAGYSQNHYHHHSGYHQHSMGAPSSNAGMSAAYHPMQMHSTHGQTYRGVQGGYHEQQQQSASAYGGNSHSHGGFQQWNYPSHNGYHNYRNYNRRPANDMQYSGMSSNNHHYSQTGYYSQNYMTSLNALASKHGIEAKFSVKAAEEDTTPDVSQTAPGQSETGPGKSASANGGQKPVQNAGGYRGQNKYYSGGSYNYSNTYGGRYGYGNDNYYSSSQRDTAVQDSNRNRENKMRKNFTAVVEVAGKEFSAYGRNPQQAKQNAASKALDDLQRNPSKIELFKKQNSKGHVTVETIDTVGSNLTPEKEESAAVDGERKAEGEAKGEEAEVSKGKDKNKSDISLVYEMGQRLGLSVMFEEHYKEVTHPGAYRASKSFIVKCKVGDHSTEAEGIGKKNAHRLAAKKMLEILKTVHIPVASSVSSSRDARSRHTPSAQGYGYGYGYGYVPNNNNGAHCGRSSMQQDWQNRRGVRGQQNKSNSESDEGALNAVSRLVQIMQIQRNTSPVFTVTSLINSNGKKGRHFHVELRVGEDTASGYGNSRKAAKKQAAIKMLSNMGYTIEKHNLLKDGKVVPPPDPNQTKCTLKKNQFLYPGRRVTFEDPSLAALFGSELQIDGQAVDDDEDGAENRQDLIDERAGYVAATDFSVLVTQRAAIARELFIKQKFASQRQQAIKIAKELKEFQKSETALKLLEDAGKKLEDVISPAQEEQSEESLSSKNQMKLLCAAVGANLSFNDHTKVGPPLEHITLLTMMLGKQFQCEGVSSNNVEEAQNKASISAIEMIASADPNGPPLPKLLLFVPLEETVQSESEVAKNPTGPDCQVSEAAQPAEESEGSNSTSADVRDSMSHQVSDTSAEHCSETANDAPNVSGSPVEEASDDSSGQGLNHERESTEKDNVNETSSDPPAVTTS